eukprot:2228157-Ditylum_brightwellii.AAC.1
MVDNAIVHPEIMAVLPKDLKLDKERPEYHRVKLKYIAEQRGDGLLCLPQGKPGEKMKALAGEQYPVLVTRIGGT